MGVDAGQHADSLPWSTMLASTDAPGAAHALAGCRSRRSYQASTAQDSGDVTGGHSSQRPLQIATGSKTSSLAGDAREHSAIDDGARLLPQMQEV